MGKPKNPTDAVPSLGNQSVKSAVDDGERWSVE